VPRTFPSQIIDLIDQNPPDPKSASLSVNHSTIGRRATARRWYAPRVMGSPGWGSGLHGHGVRLLRRQGDREAAYRANGYSI